MVLGPVHLLGLAGGPTGWLTVDTGGAGTVPIPPALALLNLLVAVGRPVSPVGGRTCRSWLSSRSDPSGQATCPSPAIGTAGEVATGVAASP
jgi:hypothetical protein